MSNQKGKYNDIIFPMYSNVFYVLVPVSHVPVPTSNCILLEEKVPVIFSHRSASTPPPIPSILRVTILINVSATNTELYCGCPVHLVFRRGAQLRPLLSYTGSIAASLPLLLPLIMPLTLVDSKTLPPIYLYEKSDTKIPKA